MPSHNAEIAKRFQQMADVMQLTGANRFRVIAFEKAAHAIADLSRDVASIDPDALTDIDGIGDGTAQRIREYLDTGTIADHEKLLAKVPPGLPALLDVPGLGAKTVVKLWKEADVDSIDALRKAIEDGSVESLKGLGKKKAQQIKDSLAFLESAGSRVNIGVALPVAEALADKLRKLDGVQRCQHAGSLRRGRETIGDIDLLVAATAEHAPAIGDAFAAFDEVDAVIAHGKTKVSIRTHNGLQCDLRVVSPDAFGAALMYFTGSKDHNVRLRERAISMGMKLSEYGLFPADTDDTANTKPLVADTEEAVYKKLKLPWVPPELREDRGEIKRAEADDLPKLIEESDIRAELHAHTTASDGSLSIRQLVDAALDRGFHTLAVTDHSKGQAQANGLDAKRLRQHIQDIHAVAAEYDDRIALLAGSEVDILADGSLDYDDDLLAELDLVVASPHAALSQDPATCTERLIKAIENPHVHIIGHPTGRLINRRAGLEPDMPAIVDAAKANGVALEINAHHARLDLRDTHARLALDAGVKLAIDTDAHGLADFQQLCYGILTARRAGATKRDVVNCLTRKQLTNWLKRD
ncbi:MAG: DNA polymerase/3'-5' exonuclease PolX [Planctomycetota bacterium]